MCISFLDVRNTPATSLRQVFLTPEARPQQVCDKFFLTPEARPQQVCDKFRRPRNEHLQLLLGFVPWISSARSSQIRKVSCTPQGVHRRVKHRGGRCREVICCPLSVKGDRRCRAGVHSPFQCVVSTEVMVMTKTQRHAAGLAMLESLLRQKHGGQVDGVISPSMRVSTCAVLKSNQGFWESTSQNVDDNRLRRTGGMAARSRGTVRWGAPHGNSAGNACCGCSVLCSCGFGGGRGRTTSRPRDVQPQRRKVHIGKTSKHGSAKLVRVRRT